MRKNQSDSYTEFIKFLVDYKSNIKLTGNLKDNLLVKAGIYKENGELSENYKF